MCAVANTVSNFFEPDTQRCSTDRTYMVQVNSFNFKSVKKAANSKAVVSYPGSRRGWLLDRPANLILKKTWSSFIFILINIHDNFNYYVIIIASLLRHYCTCHVTCFEIQCENQLRE